MVVDSNKLMKVVVNASTGTVDDHILVRSKHSATEDILIEMRMAGLFNNITESTRPTDSLTLKRVYIGASTLTDGELMATTPVCNVGDSIGAIGIDDFYYLFSQHGWTIPRGSISTVGSGEPVLDATDIGSIWKDATNHQFVIGHVSSAYIYFVPVTSYNSETGCYEASWDKNSNSYPTSFTYMSGGETGHHTGTFTITTTRYDLKVQVSERKYFVDGKQVSDGVYYCDDFKYCEYVHGKNPAGVPPTAWNIAGVNATEPEYNGDMAILMKSYDFVGSALTYNLNLSAVVPFVMRVFYGVVPQFPVMNGDYHSLTFIPKVAKAKGGQPMELPFDTDNGNPNASAERNATDLYDVNDLPDRCVCYLRDDNGAYLLGMAAGFSLVDGMTVKARRNEALAGFSATLLTYGGAGTPNKLFNKILVPSSFDNAIVPATYANTLSAFFCWFNPNENDDNVKVFWYKVSDGFVVYIHYTQELNESTKVEVTLPDFMEGMAVSQVVEKTNQATLLTDVVSCGKLCCGFDAFDGTTLSNYLVLKLS